jgi:hypothetical protein
MRKLGAPIRRQAFVPDNFVKKTGKTDFVMDYELPLKKSA